MTFTVKTIHHHMKLLIFCNINYEKGDNGHSIKWNDMDRQEQIKYSSGQLMLQK